MYGMREMREAPKDGYKNEIVLNANDPLLKYPIFFFCKSGNKYGKGYINNMNYDWEDGVVWVNIEFNINPTGERNVIPRD